MYVLVAAAVMRNTRCLLIGVHLCDLDHLRLEAISKSSENLPIINDRLAVMNLGVTGRLYTIALISIWKQLQVYL
jgi:hypothetical protein